jgi:hypothetical protein
MIVFMVDLRPTKEDRGGSAPRRSKKNMKRLILTSLLAVFTVSGALAQQFTVTLPGGHDREWYEGHGYRWHDGQWYRGEERERHEYREQHRHHGYWKDGHYYRYDDERD